ncbi:LINE-1 retrotransposable element O protein [Sesamum angolense]|uniref:LINE-1 retrotransposable element O protein n=1 Tax=Sesamum angolense TaxID=2727404 RepID=A0AAE1WKW7_9LAMI|nr:LINE-1 retrotransposable element O protein [Sesamum angolense]
MNLLMWNCQGLGGPWTVRSLGNLIRDYHPALVFLAETKCSSRRIDSLKRRFDMFGFSVDSRGKGGGLALLWRKSVDVVLQSYSHNHIDVSVRLNESQDWWRFTGLYGEPETAKREATWRLLSQLHTRSVRPWLVAGDFNEILDQSEKWGEPFTWSNHHSSPGTIRERLDRACANWGWTQLFPNVSVLHLSANCSDHSALLVKLDGRPALNLRGFRPWRFEAAWLQTEQCANIVAENWRCPLSSNPTMALFERLEACQLSLTRWSKESLHNDRQRISQLEHRLTTLLSGILTPERLEEASALRQELENRAAREETVWRQRREWVEDVDGIRRYIISYFHDVFASSRPQETDIAIGTEHLRQVVDASMAEDLLQPFTAIEVKSALFSMAPLKSPGPDGMSPIFFQKFWHIVQTDVTSCALNLLNSLVMPPSLNATNIVLIPKCKHPEYLTQFRSISLCNVVYKIASKAIANRLKVLLDRIISPFQSAFVPGRLITDNVLLAFELNHFLNTKTKGGQGYMALKLDVSKAHDKVEWAFLKQVMLKLGFPPVLAESAARIQGISICRGAPCISHLLFADDTLIFSKASLSSVRAIKDLLEIYRRASGQEINFHKSSVAFSRNTPEALSIGLASVLNIRKENKMELYLGLPSRVRLSGTDLPILGAVLWLHIGFSVQVAGGGLAREKRLRCGQIHGFLGRSLFGPSPPNERIEFLRVSDLINQETGDWNSTVIQDIFLPLDCEVILGIPLGRTVCEDLLIWHYSTQWSLLCRNLSRRIPGSCFACPFCSAVAEDVLHCLKIGQTRVRVFLLHLLGLMVVQKQQVDGPLAEAFAAREAVLFAINRGWQNVILEGDCATLITKLLSGLRDFSAIGSITLDIQNLISYFQFSRFSFVQRSCNSVAHALAKLALGSASGESNIPAPAAHFVMLDKLATT